MSHKSDWVSYVISAFYLLVVIGCILGIRKNFQKKKSLLDHNQYARQRRVVVWRYRFYWTLLFACIVRIASLIAAVITGKTMVLAQDESREEFAWSLAASIGSNLFYTAFSFIIWFFAHLAFHEQPKKKKFITPFFTGINVALYISTVTIAISSFAAKKWDLVYDYILPLFAVCGWILAVCFIYLSYVIKGSIKQERRDTEIYIENSRRMSLSHQAHRIYGGAGSANNSPLMGSQNVNNSSNRNIGIYGGGSGGNLESSIGSKNRALPNAVPLNMNNQSQISSATMNQSSAKHITDRLVKLSFLCALCWTARGLYLMSIRIWDSTDKTPFAIPELAWEALFYFLTEYPPSVGSLWLMLKKPRRGRQHLSMAESEYPNAAGQY